MILLCRGSDAARRAKMLAGHVRLGTSAVWMTGRPGGWDVTTTIPRLDLPAKNSGCSCARAAGFSDGGVHGAEGQQALVS